MEQRQRDRVMGLFRAQKADLLIATDVAARGLDIEHLSHVVNYDVPASPEVYLHRIGRTGRAGRGGTAITLAEPREQRHLRAIENFTKTKIEVATVPTLAELRARQLDLLRASLREQLVAGDFDSMKVVVGSLAEEFDLVDVAAAALKLAQTATGGDGEQREIPTAKMHDAGPRPGRERSMKPARQTQSQAGGPSVRLFIGAGRQAGIRPGDLVGAITGEAGIESRSLGAIEIADRFSLVEVPDDLADNIIRALRASTIRGNKVSIRRDREAGR
jgi:ATP-dependent RNA helicase DeaD